LFAPFGLRGSGSADGSGDVFGHRLWRTADFFTGGRISGDELGSRGLGWHGLGHCGNYRAESKAMKEESSASSARTSEPSALKTLSLAGDNPSGQDR